MRKYFSGNYVFPSPKSSDPPPKTEKNFHRNSGPNLAGICRAARPFSFVQPALKPRRVTLNLDVRTLTLVPLVPVQFSACSIVHSAVYSTPQSLYRTYQKSLKLDR